MDGQTDIQTADRWIDDRQIEQMKENCSTSTTGPCHLTQKEVKGLYFT